MAIEYPSIDERGREILVKIPVFYEYSAILRLCAIDQGENHGESRPYAAYAGPRLSEAPELEGELGDQ